MHDNERASESSSRNYGGPSLRHAYVRVGKRPKEHGKSGDGDVDRICVDLPRKCQFRAKIPQTGMVPPASLFLVLTLILKHLESYDLVT